MTIMSILSELWRGGGERGGPSRPRNSKKAQAEQSSSRIEELWSRFSISPKNQR